MPDETSDRRRFVVGLGNPGRQYARTRHNVGFRVVEELARRWSAEAPRQAFGGQLREARPIGPDGTPRRVMLLTPQTYMNRSGSPVQELASYYKAAGEDLMIVLDDMNLPTGMVRARASGSAGGQKGLADILAKLGTRDVPRLRIGIGAPPGRMDGADYVLGRFTEAEEEAVGPAIVTAADAVEAWLARGMTFVMDRYNRKAES